MFELSSGSLYRKDINNELELFADNVYGIAETQMSVDEVAPISYDLRHSASLSCEMKYFDVNLLNEICGNPVPTKSFILEYSIPIMIQARWHKKPRIRKKWLKRYGMKPDAVKIKTNASAVEYNTDDGSFTFTTDNLKYAWRPDQKRRGVKIEW